MPPPALAHRAGHLWEQVVLPARTKDADLLLNPANLAPLASTNNVVVIHDAAALVEPGWYSPLYARWQARVLPALARRAVRVVTVSTHSKEELTRLTGATRISVVPGGVGEQFRPDVTPAERQRPYVLCVASATARKNLTALVPVARELQLRGVDVVVAGGSRPQFAGEQGLGALTHLGPVPEAELPGLYAGATAFVLPSLHEGFGLTALEAMACGTPVVASRRGALPETCGDAALLVEPEPEPLARALHELLDGEHPALRERGIARAARFTWDRTARELHALLLSAAAA